MVRPAVGVFDGNRTQPDDVVGQPMMTPHCTIGDAVVVVVGRVMVVGAVGRVMVARVEEETVAFGVGRVGAVMVVVVAEGAQRAQAVMSRRHLGHSAGGATPGVLPLVMRQPRV